MFLRINTTSLQVSARLMACLGLFSVSGLLYAADIYRGRDLFNQHCMSCHEPGRPIPGAQDFALGQGMMQSDIALRNKIERGKNIMPGYRGVLTNQMIMDIIAYMRTLR